MSDVDVTEILDDERVREEIRGVAPHLGDAPLVFLGEGMDSRAFLAGGEVVFRFPKHAEAGKRLEREIGFLPHLAPRVSLEIPRFDHVGRQSGSGLPFVGYPLLRGLPLDRSLLDGLSTGAREDVFDAIAGFIRELRSFPAEEALSLGVIGEETWANSLENRARARIRVYPLLTPSERSGLEHLFDDFLGDPANRHIEPTLLHADLSPEHLVFCPERQRLTSVIDFGDLTLGDPDYELFYLYSDLGPEVVEAVLKRLPHPDPDRLGRKLRYYSIVNTIEDILIGLERPDDVIRDESLAQFRALTASSPRRPPVEAPRGDGYDDPPRSTTPSAQR